MGCQRRCAGSIPASPPLHYPITQYLLGIKLSICYCTFYSIIKRSKSGNVLLQMIHINSCFLSSRCIPEAHLGSQRRGWPQSPCQRCHGTQFPWLCLAFSSVCSLLASLLCSPKSPQSPAQAYNHRAGQSVPTKNTLLSLFKVSAASTLLLCYRHQYSPAQKIK